MPDIVATAGAANANSFATEVEQIAYMDARLGASDSDWETFSGSTLTDDEKRAMIEAARDINQVGFKGLRVDDVQVMEFPRQLCPNPDDPSGADFGTTVIPQRLKNAQMELAYQYVKAGATDLAALPSSAGIRRTKIDVLETEFEPYQVRTGLDRFPRVWGELAPLMEQADSFTAHLTKG